MPARFALLLTIAAIGAAGGTNAYAAGELFGQHVAACAQMSLGERADPSAVTCTHDGTSVTFPTFGAMVAHMRAGGC
jgi:hypothetical protein